MKLLIVGGSPSHAGGVEAFCSRASEAINLRPGYQAEWLPTNTAYLRPRSVPQMLRSLAVFWRRRREDWSAIWLQYVNIADLVFLVVARMAGMKVIVTPHLGTNWISTRIPFLNYVSCAVLSLSSKLAYLSETQLSELKLPSQVQRCRIRTFLPKSIGTGQLGAEPKSGKGAIKLIHAGRLSRGKGTYLFIDVCARLKLNNFPYVAEIIGSCEEATRTELKDLIHQNGLQDRVVLYQAMQEEDLMKKLAGADVLVHLSVMDSFPLIVLESIAAGLYPVCIDLPGARSMTEDYCGQVVGSANAVQAVVDVLINGDLDAMALETKRAREEISEDYSWSTCVAVLGKCIDPDGASSARIAH